MRGPRVGVGAVRPRQVALVRLPLVSPCPGVSSGVGPRSRNYSVALEWAEGRTETLEMAADETVVDAAEAAGIGLPYGCLYGACGTAGRRGR